MRSLALLFFAMACGPSTPSVPAVTCADVQLETANGSCDLVGEQQCSDGNFYEIDCQDDGTCSCSFNGMVQSSVFASNQQSGYCATFNASQFHSLSVLCGWNLNPN